MPRLNATRSMVSRVPLLVLIGTSDGDRAFMKV